MKQKHFMVFLQYGEGAQCTSYMMSSEALYWMSELFQLCSNAFPMGQATMVTQSVNEEIQLLGLSITLLKRANGYSWPSSAALLQ